eukprot:GHUV01041303.1.p1 GENE.GHUV01041303.1~~GHUV01041303.1.p1  ORF type:complete len:116 (+),score=31.97 GHUV01041303.1:301-648(+)
MSPCPVPQDVDMQSGHVSGIMQASNVPGMQQPIETFWEGCVIDDVNNTFYTRCWGASRDTDLQHWGKFEGWSELIRCVHVGYVGVLAFVDSRTFNPCVCWQQLVKGGYSVIPAMP